MRLALDPVVIVLLALAAGLYVRAIRILRGRGVRIPRARQAAWWLGLALLAAGLLSPVAAYADELLSLHMAEHLLIGDLAAPFLVAGLRSPVLLFFPPRPVLVFLARRHGLRRAFALARRPLVALGIYVLVLYGWHLAFAFEAALRDPLVHALQHQSFLLANVLLWWVVLEPQRMAFPPDLWKIAYVFAARMASLMFGMAVVVTRTPIYGGFYGSRARAHGLTPLSDQQIGAGLMMVVDVLMIIGTLSYVFWVAAREGADEGPAGGGRPGAVAAAAPPATRP